MVTSVFACGFECGVSAASSHLPILGGSPTIDTGTFRTGLRAGRSQGAVTANRWELITDITAATRVLVGRFYVRFASLPGNDSNIFAAGTASAFCKITFKQSDSKLYASTEDGGGTHLGATGVSVTTGVWYRIAFKFVISANPWTSDVSVDGTACGQATTATAAANWTTVRLGLNVGAATGDAYYDDMLFSQTSGDYPLGAGTVEAVTVTSDGTHNVAGTNDFERTLTGTDIDNTTTTAYQLIDDIPLETGASVDWINLIAPPNATDYVECVFGTSAETRIPQGVEVIAGVHASSVATACNIRLALRNSNGATQDDVTNAAPASTTVVYRHKHYNVIPGGTGWTLVAYQNLRVRCYTSDATPDPYFDCIILEAAFQTVSKAVIPVFMNQYRQRRN